MEREYRREIVEHTSPVWRVLGVGLTAGAIVVLGFYLEQVGFADEFSTVAAVAVLGTMKFWAQERPDQVRLRAGPFGKVADALRESLDDINAWVLQRPLRVGFVIAVAYGIGLVVVKSVILVVVTSLYDWKLAAFVGLLIGAAAAAPQLFSAAGRRLSGPTGADPGEAPKRQVDSSKGSKEIEKGERMTENPRNRENPDEEYRRNAEAKFAAPEDSVGIGYYDERGNRLSPEEFQALVAEKAERMRDEGDE